MARVAKKDEGMEMPDFNTIKIDTTPEPLVEVPKRESAGRPQDDSWGTMASRAAAPKQASEPVNCLRNERVVVQFVAAPNAMVQTKGHVLWGGMHEAAHRSFVVPKLRSGQYVNVLTNNEMAYLEQVMHLSPGSLSVHNRENNFWNDANPNGIGKVTLHKQKNYLDLSDPIDYIKYKVLLANKDYICPSLQELEDRPKATYQFVIISENAETQMNLSRNDAKMECYMEYGAVRQDADTLRTILEILTGRPLAAQSKLDFLQSKTMESLEADPRRFLMVIKDELLPTKVLIKKAVEAGIITRRNDFYYYEGNPMCKDGEDSTLNNAAKWLSDVKRQELKFALEARVKG